MPQQYLTASFEKAREAAPAAARSLYNFAFSFVEKRIPDIVPRDKITKRLIGAGALAYCADVWSPLPVGESIAIGFAAAATARGKYLYRKNHGPYTRGNSILNLQAEIQ